MLFQRLGYKTTTTKGSYDGGVDVIAVKEGQRHLIQCKKFKIQKVSVGMVREFYGALADRLSHAKGYFITTGTFTLEAEKYAQDKSIELIDGARLMGYMKLAGFEGQVLPQESATFADPESGLKCPICAGEMTLKVASRGSIKAKSSGDAKRSRPAGASSKWSRTSRRWDYLF